jgi:hypothetical protein
LLLIHHLIGQNIVVIVRLPSSSSFPTGKFLAFFDFLDGLLSFALSSLLFGRLRLWFWRDFILVICVCRLFFFLGSLTRSLCGPAVIIIPDLRGGDII